MFAFILEFQLSSEVRTSMRPSEHRFDCNKKLYSGGITKPEMKSTMQSAITAKGQLTIPKAYSGAPPIEARRPDQILRPS
jgi:hypothetical protein